MNALELLATLRAQGVYLEPAGDKLRVQPASKLDTVTLELLKQHKAALLALLNQRDADTEGCPEHWLHIALIPPKGSSLDTQDRYRVKLFGCWYLIRHLPDISPTHVHVTSQDTVRRMFASLEEFYRWAWAEHYLGPALSASEGKRELN